MAYIPRFKAPIVYHKKAPNVSARAQLKSTLLELGRKLTRWLRLRSLCRIWEHAHQDARPREDIGGQDAALAKRKLKF